jgi:uncharacterized protein (TIGR02147 family)
MLQSPRSAPYVFEYLDFREFLRRRYEELHKLKRTFSYRYIGLKVGLDSGSVSRVLNQDRKISVEIADKLAAVFGLRDAEAEYFQTLVFFCQSRSNAEKNHYLEKLLRLRPVHIRTLEEKQFRFYKDWYNLAIWTLLHYYPFNGDAKALARMLTPVITAAQAQESLDLLKEIGLVAEKNGKLQVTDCLLSSGEAIPAFYLNNLHLEMAKLSQRFLELFETRERDFSGLTLTLSGASFEKIREKLKKYRLELLQIARQEKDSNRVYRMNLQLFPLTLPFGRGAS